MLKKALGSECHVDVLCMAQPRQFITGLPTTYLPAVAMRTIKNITDGSGGCWFVEFREHAIEQLVALLVARRYLLHVLIKKKETKEKERTENEEKRKQRRE